jgi:hypothetical protein
VDPQVFKGVIKPQENDIRHFNYFFLLQGDHALLQNNIFEPRLFNQIDAKFRLNTPNLALKRSS